MSIINREEAIERLERKYIEEILYDAGIRDAVKIVKEMPSAWIPVSKAEPECPILMEHYGNKWSVYVSEKVWVTYLGYYDKKPYTSERTARFTEDGLWFWDEEHDDEQKCHAEVIAWMPMPDPADIEGDDEHEEQQTI